MRRLVNDSNIIKGILILSILAVIYGTYVATKDAGFMLPSIQQLLIIVKLFIVYGLLLGVYCYLISNTVNAVSRNLVQIDTNGLDLKRLKRNLLSMDGLKLLLTVLVFLKFSTLVQILSDFLASSTVTKYTFTSQSARLAATHATIEGYKLVNFILFGLIMTLIYFKRQASKFTSVPGTKILKREIITPLDSAIRTLPYTGLVTFVYYLVQYR